jgi:hypothetical protein
VKEFADATTDGWQYQLKHIYFYSLLPGNAATPLLISSPVITSVAADNRCYVPEWLLKRWDMAVETNF